MPNVAATPLILPRSSMWHIHSPFDGTVYRILIALPHEPPPENGYPAVFLLDANATFMSTVESLRMRARRRASTGIEPAVVVGIGYDTDSAYDPDRRVYDFTRVGTVDIPRAGYTQRRTGGAALLGRFIDDVVRPLAARQAPLDPERQSLFGHSLGGVYVLSQLLTAPQSFESYIAISPSIWSDEAWLLEKIAQLPDRLPASAMPRRVLLTVGEYEQSLAPWQQNLSDVERIAALRAARGMRDKAQSFARQLTLATNGGAKTGRLIVRFEELSGEDHASSALVGISHGLRMALWEGAAALHNIS